MIKSRYEEDALDESARLIKAKIEGLEEDLENAYAMIRSFLFLRSLSDTEIGVAARKMLSEAGALE